MAVKMRLRREGKKKAPAYRVVVADARSPRDGRFIDDLGYYQPLDEPSTISIDRERALRWLRQGAQPTDQVKQLLRIEGIWEEFKPGDSGRDRSDRIAARAREAEQREKAIAQREAEDARRLAEQQAASDAEAAADEDQPPADAAAEPVAGADEAQAAAVDEPVAEADEEQPAAVEPSEGADAGDAGAAPQEG